MRELKSRIYYQQEDTGHITCREMELGHPIPELGNRWFVIARCQYTGLKDKNGKEIYEGDIVKRIGDFGTIQYSDKHELIDIVEFKGGCFHPVCEEPEDNFEIIGNIYETQKC